MKERLADLITLVSAVIATLSLEFIVVGSYDVASRMVLLTYVLDLLDGMCARKCGSSMYGALLDRCLDRYTQVVLPSLLVIFASVNSSYHVFYLAYSVLLVTYSFYRFAYRDSSKLGYYVGTPLHVHGILIIFFILLNELPNPYILMYILILSFIPVRYYTAREANGVRLAIIIILTMLAFSPVNSVTRWIFLSAILFIIVYVTVVFIYNVLYLIYNNNH